MAALPQNIANSQLDERIQHEKAFKSFNRKSIWAMSFAGFSFALFMINIRIELVALLSMATMLVQIFYVEKNIANENRSHAPICISGAFLSASILFVSATIGAFISAAINLPPSGSTILVSVVISASLYASLTFAEGFISAVLQNIFAENGDSGAKIAFLIAKKYGGFLGNIR